MSLLRNIWPLIRNELKLSSPHDGYSKVCPRNIFKAILFNNNHQKQCKPNNAIIINTPFKMREDSDGPIVIRQNAIYMTLITCISLIIPNDWITQGGIAR